MRDFPMFTTEYGIASLTLKQIPYWGSAYIRIQDSKEPEKLLAECVDFCRCAGAQRIYATGHSVLEKYPLFSHIVRMTCLRESIAETDASLIPVLPDNLERFRQIYNEKMFGVQNTAYMTVSDSQELLRRGNGYFVHRDGVLLGIGIAGGTQIDCVISLVKGAGADIVKALCNTIFGDTVTLEVALENSRAIKLYEGLGFIKNCELSAWFKIL